MSLRSLWARPLSLWLLLVFSSHLAAGLVKEEPADDAAEAAAVPSASEDAVKGLVASLSRSEASVEGLEASVQKLHNRIQFVEEETEAADRNISAARQELVDLDHVANRSVDRLKQLGLQGAEINAVVQYDQPRLDKEEQEGADTFLASEGLALSAEQAMDAGSIKNGAGLCMDVDKPGRKGASIHLSSCMVDVDGQEWAHDPITGHVKNRHGICLDTTEPDKPGGQVMMWTCRPGIKTQQWVYDRDTSRLRSKIGICLGAEDPMELGSLVEMQECKKKSKAQQWHYIGGTGIKRELETLNKKIWAAIDPTSATALKKMERNEAAVETDFISLEGDLTKTVRVALAKRFRGRMDGLRGALKNLGAAAAGNKPVFSIDDSIETTPPPFGADLGLV